MPNILEFPEFSIRLSRDEWMAISLKLAGRVHNIELATNAEVRMIAQLKSYGEG